MGPTLPALVAAHRDHPRLRDAQYFVRHRDPRTTRRYDHSRDSLDRNAAYTLAAYLA